MATLEAHLSTWQKIKKKLFFILLHSAENMTHFSCSLCMLSDMNAVFFQPMTQTSILVFLSVITDFRFHFWYSFLCQMNIK